MGAWQGLGGEAKAVAKVLGAWPRPWGLVQGRGDVSKAVRANPISNPNAYNKAVGA